MVDLALKALLPKKMLRLYMAVVLVISVCAVGSVLYASSRVDRRASHASTQSNSALLASQIQGGLRLPLSHMLAGIYSFLRSPEFAALSDSEQALVTSGLIVDVDQPLAPMAPLPSVSIPLRDRDALEVQRSLQVISQQLDRLAAEADQIDLELAFELRDRIVSSVASYIDEPTADNFRDLLGGVFLMSQTMSQIEAALAADVVEQQGSLASAMALERYTAIAAVMVLIVIPAGATVYVSRLLQQTFASGEAERRELRETAASLRFRNDQLNALYNVFAEITDTLSMRHVISATLRETLRVMDASMVTLRLVEGSQLVVAGNLTSTGLEIPNLPPVAVGEGPTGTVALRGRSMRIARGAQALLGPSLAPDDPNSGVDSGIVSPLIVGAQVVGTLACWSRKADAYAEDDERVLEMMASQVATAIIAAETTETSQQHAMQDPLTGLPNRRQLAFDITTDLASWATTGRPAAVGMIDIDRFKRFNDDFGHRVGDVTLQRVGATIRRALRPSDSVYRYGGEEFVVVFAQAEPHEALELAQTLLAAVSALPVDGYKEDESVRPITASIGLAFLHEHGTDFLQLIELADRAMYTAKSGGGNRVAAWRQEPASPQPVDANVERLGLQVQPELSDAQKTKVIQP
jgi:diguanylate cyclase (GGDEF)-like protein